MKNKLICTLIFVIFSGNTFSQSFQLDKAGIVVFNKPSFKHFAILMQDTTLGNGNRIDSWWDSPKNDKNWQNQKLFTLPAFILDNALFVKCDEKLIYPDSTVAFYNYPDFPNKNDKLRKNIKKYIRLYIGYIDISGQRKIVVQFITPKEFKKMQHIYCKELFLVAHQKNLRYAVIKLKASH